MIFRFQSDQWWLLMVGLSHLGVASGSLLQLNLPAAWFRILHHFLPIGESREAVASMPLPGVACRAGPPCLSSIPVPPPPTFPLDEDPNRSVPSHPYYWVTRDLSARTAGYQVPLSEPVLRKCEALLYLEFWLTALWDYQWGFFEPLSLW